MAGILGFNFHLGPEVPRPPRADPSRNWDDCTSERRTWAKAMRDAAREHDAWGLLCTAPDCDVTLRDVMSNRSFWRATEASRVHLLLAEEESSGD